MGILPPLTARPHPAWTANPVAHFPTDFDDDDNDDDDDR